jgi:tetratricopeptide (TPR) repeat protein
MARILAKGLLCLIAAGAFTLAAFGQGRGGTTTPPPATGGGGGGGTGNPGTGGTSRNTGTNDTNNPQSQTQTQRANIPIFVSGRVMLEDGSPPPNRVTIQRMCGTRPHNEGYTDSKGYFSIQLGSSAPNVFQDASTGGLDDPSDRFNTMSGTQNNNSGITERDLMNCELRADLPGYRSQAVPLMNRRPMDNPDIGTIFLHRIGATEGTTISATTLAAPKDARKAYEKGIELAKKNKLDEARANMEHAVEIYPRYAQAWTDLARMQASKGEAEAARESLARAIQADDKFVPPYIELSRIQLSARQWQQLADTTDRALRLDSFNYPQAYFFNAVANYNLHRVDAAEESVRRAQRLDSRHQLPQTSHLLGVILADRKDYTAAAEQIRDYLKFAPDAQNAADVRQQLQRIEQMAKTPVAVEEPR